MVQSIEDPDEAVIISDKSSFYGEGGGQAGDIGIIKTEGAEFIVTDTTATTDFKYYIIGGSFKSEENASKYVWQLNEQGYTGKDLGVFKGLHRVAMKGFLTMEEAQRELNLLLQQSPQSGIWIHVNE